MKKNLIIYFLILSIGIGNLIYRHRGENEFKFSISYQSDSKNLYLITVREYSTVINVGNVEVNNHLEIDLEDLPPRKYNGRGFWGKLKSNCKNTTNFIIFEIKSKWKHYHTELKNRQFQNIYHIQDIAITRNGLPLDIDENVKLKIYNNYLKYSEDYVWSQYDFDKTSNNNNLNDVFPIENRPNYKGVKENSWLMEEGKFEILYVGGYCLFFSGDKTVGIAGGDGMADIIPREFECLPFD